MTTMFYEQTNRLDMAQLVKNPPAMRETWVRSPGWEDPLEKRKVTHSSILVWRIPWPTVHGVAKRWTRLSDFHFTSLLQIFPTQGSNPGLSHCGQMLYRLGRRQWHPTPVLLPGKSYGQRSLVGYSPWDHKELDIT